MRLLLDTQAFLWAISAPERLRRSVRRALEDEANEVFVSAASAWEIAIKVRLERLRLPDDPQRFVPEQMAENALQPLPVQIRHALRVFDLPDVHRDPFDRLLVAQAVVEDLVLVTGDPQLRRYPVRVLW